MSSPVNPVLVIKNNLPEWEAELEAERTKLLERVTVLDEELATIQRIKNAVSQP